MNVVDDTRRGALKPGALTHVRKTATGTEPYFTRAEIEGGALKGKGLELLYFADPVDVFFMQIQGSGRVKLTDGTTVRVHYDGKNGHPYSSIGRYLMEKALFAADRMSMSALATWLRADPERGKQVMWQNTSYVFFREIKDETGAPLGAMRVPLTPERSLAIDTAYHALGTPVYVSVPTMKHVPNASPFNRLMVGQDVGSAIRGAERGDIYFGSGDAAGKLAGTTKHPGKFFVLVPNARVQGRRPARSKEKAQNEPRRRQARHDRPPHHARRSRAVEPARRVSVEKVKVKPRVASPRRGASSCSPTVGPAGGPHVRSGRPRPSRRAAFAPPRPAAKPQPAAPPSRNSTAARFARLPRARSPSTRPSICTACSQDDAHARLRAFLAELPGKGASDGPGHHRQRRRGRELLTTSRAASAAPSAACCAAACRSGWRSRNCAPSCSATPRRACGTAASGALYVRLRKAREA